MFRRIFVEAVSVDQAMSQLQSGTPEGYEVMQTEVLSDAKYRAQLFHPAVVRVSYQAKAKVSATLMSRGAADEARAAARELMDLVDQTEAPTEQIRMIGLRLESTGGVELMLAAHTVFSKERPRAKRVVEQAWDGIGAWIG